MELGDLYSALQKDDSGSLLWYRRYGHAPGSPLACNEVKAFTPLACMQLVAQRV